MDVAFQSPRGIGRAGLMIVCCCAALPVAARAQQRQPADTGGAQADSLTRRPITMQAVTITTTAPMRMEPSATVHVSPQVIQQTPASDAWDLLRQTSGIEVHEQGQGPGFASDAALRGFSSDHSTDLALWVDGVPINEPVNGHAEGYDDFSVLLPEAISSIEVLKGPTSALYGNFAMAGVVNVRTLDRMNGTQLDLTGGSYGRLEGALLTGVDRPGTGAVLAVRGLREDGWRPNSGYALGQVHGRWVRDLSPNTTVDAGVELYDAGWDSPGFLSDSMFAIRDYHVAENPSDGGMKRRAQERVSLRRILGNGVLWRSTAYATQGRWQLYLTIPPEPGSGEGSGSQTEEEDTRGGLGATSALTYLLPRGEITVGGEARLDASHYERWFTTARVRDSSDLLVHGRQLSGAMFLEASLDLTPHVRATVGGRYDALTTRSTPPSDSAISAGHGTLSPKFGLLVHIPDIGAIYGNVSKGFRQTDGVIADPTLPFITEWAYEAGVKIDRPTFSASAALFRVDVSNEQTFNPITLESTSGGASRRKGVELEGAWRPAGPLSFTADWTFNDARYLQTITEDGDTLNGTRVFNTARYVGSGAVEFRPVRALWHLRLSTNVVGPYTPFDEPGVELNPYALVHVSAGVPVTSRVSLEAGVRNLLNRAYPELEAGGFVSPGEPRTLFLSARAGV